MTIGTAAVVAILCGVVFKIIRSMIKDKKAGKSLQCGMNCMNCSEHCSTREK